MMLLHAHRHASNRFDQSNPWSCSVWVTDELPQHAECHLCAGSIQPGCMGARGAAAAGSTQALASAAVSLLLPARWCASGSCSAPAELHCTVNNRHLHAKAERPPCQHSPTDSTLSAAVCTAADSPVLPLYHCFVPICTREPKPLADSPCSRPNALRAFLGASGWAAYFHQSTLLPGLALALLYFSVLSLGSLMTSYLAWQGLSEATLSLFRAVGALSGLLATVVFPPLQHCGLGLVGAGALGISWQVGV